MSEKHSNRHQGLPPVFSSQDRTVLLSQLARPQTMKSSSVSLSLTPSFQSINKSY